MYGTYQRGLSTLGALIAIIALIFVSYLFLKLAPSYYQHMMVVNSLKATVKDQPLVGGNIQQFKHELAKEFEKYLDINGVSGVTSENLSLSQENEATYVNLNYQIRIHIIGNIDVLLQFNDKLKAVNE